jgi:hypothetical protein
MVLVVHGDNTHAARHINLKLARGAQDLGVTRPSGRRLGQLKLSRREWPRFPVDLRRADAIEPAGRAAGSWEVRVRRANAHALHFWARVWDTRWRAARSRATASIGTCSSS